MSIELPNGKISLTLPEQVGHNAKQISKIFQLLDGLNVQDNVVVVDDISHVLTAQEITVLQQAVAFIVYDGHLYIKSGESGSNAYFDIVFSITPPGTAITFASSRITANLSNGALAIANSSVNTYSVSQIDSLLSAKASITYVDSNFAALSGANFTGAITAPSIIESMSGYSFTKQTMQENLTIEYVYAGVVKNGNKITLVTACKLTKTASATISNQRIGAFTVPVAVGNQIYPVLIGTYEYIDVRKIQAASTGWTTLDASVYTQKSGSNVIYMGVDGTAFNSMTVNTPYYLRYEVTILLSDNLAS